MQVYPFLIQYVEDYIASVKPATQQLDAVQFM